MKLFSRSREMLNSGCAAALAAATFLLTGGLRADMINPADFERSFTITFPGYSDTETLTDFPVLVRLSAARNAFDYSKCKVANGGDLRFSDADGNLLASEVDTWNPDGESLVWVKVPSLDQDTIITAHYGCASPAAITTSDVWSNGYLGVWHLNGDTSPLSDSTGGGKNFTRSNDHVNMVSLGGAGIIGNAPEFAMLENQDGTHDGYIRVSDSDSKFAGMATMTIEMWVFQREFATNRRFLYKKQGNDTALDFTLTYPDYSGKSRLGFAFATTNKQENVSAITKTLYNRYSDEGTNVWRHFALVFDSIDAQRLQAYVNGANNNSSDDSVALNQGYSVLPNGGDLYLGNLSAKRAFPGKIDEFRISSVARSAAWVKATYDTVNSEDFASYRVPNDWKKYTHTFTVSFPGATNGVLTSFPVLVKVSESAIPGFRYADCLKENGGDLRFADADGNLLDSEIDTWDTNGVSLVWVNVPSLANNTAIKAYYGWEFAPAVDSMNVWTNGYVGVWHMGESASPLKASTQGSVEFSTFTAGTYETIHGIQWAQTGVIGGATKFGPDAIYTNSCLRTTADDADAYEGMDALTVEAWACRDTDVQDTGYILDMTQHTSNNWAWRLYDYKQSGVARVWCSIYTENGSEIQLSGSTVPTNTWTYKAFTYDSQIENAHNFFLYVNGLKSTNEKDGGNLPVKTTGTGRLYLGNQLSYNHYTAPYPGRIDEVRISNVARSAGWLATTYDMIKGNANFSTYGNAKANKTGTIIYYK